MLVVETLAKIRRDRLVHGKSIRAIAKNRGVSPTRTVKSSDRTRRRWSRFTTGANNHARSSANMKLCWKPCCCPTIRPRGTICSISSRCLSYCAITATAVAMMPYAVMPVTGNNTMVIRKMPSFRCTSNLVRLINSIGRTRRWSWVGSHKR